MKKFYAVATMAVLLCLACMVMSGTAFADDRCVDNGGGTVTDNGTGLMWQKETAGRMNWNTAMNYASSLSLDGHTGWWLPNKDELQALYHSPCKSMMVVKSSSYWSSTTGDYPISTAWRVNFYSGGVYKDNRSSSHYVRAVRAGQ